MVIYCKREALVLKNYDLFHHHRKKLEPMMIPLEVFSEVNHGGLQM